MRPILANLILGSRCIAAVRLPGPMAALALFTAPFAAKPWTFGTGVLTAQEDKALLDLAHRPDRTLVASLGVTVILASRDSQVTPFGVESMAGGMSWIRRPDPGDLAVTPARSIVAISSIQAPQMFLRADGCADRMATSATALRAVFLLVPPLTDRIAGVSRPRRG